ncbi:hypothetical protein KKI23_03475 [Patescibacteria group bacterium]|nr:hypothetical protein [Patescibacteria group bacterium]
MAKSPENFPEDMREFIDDPNSSRSQEERVGGIIEDKKLEDEIKDNLSDPDRRLEEETFYHMEMDIRGPYSDEYLERFQQIATRQVEFLEKVDDGVDRNALLQQWQKIKEQLEQGDVSGYLAENERRIKSQTAQMLEINGRISDLPEGGLEKLNLAKQKEQIIERLRTMVRDQRDLFLVAHTEAEKRGEKEDPEKRLKGWLKSFCQKMNIRAEKEENQKDQKIWKEAIDYLKTDDINYVYGVLNEMAGRLDNTLTQIKTNIEKPPKNMTENEMEEMAQLTREWTEMLKTRGQMEILINEIDALKQKPDQE